MVTSKEQYERHKFVSRIFCDENLRALFLLLNDEVQYEIAMCYLPIDEMAEDQFRSHLIELRKDPSFSINTAGKYYKRFKEISMGIISTCGSDRNTINREVLDRMFDWSETGNCKIPGAKRSNSSDIYALPIHLHKSDIEKLSHIIMASLEG
jgi:hypothetical protein